MARTASFQFDPNQEHQLRAIEAAVQLFDDLPRQDAAAFQLGDDIIPNLPPNESLDEAWLLDNLNAVRAANDFGPSLLLDVDEGLVLDGAGIDSWRFPVYTVEMETGTGKTYVYLRTIYELRKRYGWRKFIIVVPSVAIFEGVRQSFEDMQEHFKSLYENETVHLTPYASAQISRLRSFASSTFTEIMVMTVDAFNKSSNNFYKPTEKTARRAAALPVRAGNPPHPHPRRIAELPERPLPRGPAHPAPALCHQLQRHARGAPQPHLPPQPGGCFPAQPGEEDRSARRDGRAELQYSGADLSVAEESPGYGLAIEATLNVYKDGQMRQEKVKLRKNDDLYEKTKNPNYKGLVIDEVNRRDGIVVLTNGDVLALEGDGATDLSREEVFRIQIRETIKAHFRKQKELLPQGIKVLSLFFIDRVANYVAPQALIPRLFDEEYDRLKVQYPFFKGWEPADVRESYFAKVSKANQPDQYEDTSIEESDKTKKEKELEKAAYEPIMKGKKRLLGFDEKKCFIFAHSALKEGWDNPNVFQICTLNVTYSERKKRQEIGRGLRLAVDQDGARVQDEAVNVLTVIANESYESYANRLQQDYRESGDTAPPPPTNARRLEAVRNDELFNSLDFRQFWERLCQRTDYRIHVDTEALVQQCIEVLNNQRAFPEPQIVVSKGRFVITEFALALQEVKTGLAQIQIRITDTEGNTSASARWYKAGDNIARIAKDDRLKGFQVVEIREAGPHSLVHFGDRGSLRQGESIKFSSEKGQVTDPRSVQEAPTTYPVFDLIGRTANETRLTRGTVMRIFKGLRRDVQEKMFRNPEGFAGVFLGTIRELLADHIATRIEYTLTDDSLEYLPESIFPPTKRFPQKRS
ncbi:MAG: DEAD/DEAH box helicase family protein [Lewinellaceae bacterium]|nr:DEAD/DEAH box helicase family protein [Lewinellaceae bacterium]